LRTKRGREGDTGHVGDDPEILRDRSALEATLEGGGGPYRKASIWGRYLKPQAPA